MNTIICLRMTYLALVVMVSIVGLRGGVDALTCYDCIQGIDANCGDTIKRPSNTNTCTGMYKTCQKTTGTANGMINSI